MLSEESTEENIKAELQNDLDPLIRIFSAFFFVPQTIPSLKKQITIITETSSQQQSTKKFPKPFMT